MRRHLPLALVFASLACDPAAELNFDYVPPLTPHQAYDAALDRAGLANTALATEWRAAAERAVSSPLLLQPPVQESGFIAGDEPSAVGYRMSLRRGQRLVINTTLLPRHAARLFIDVFRAAEVGAPVLLASADSSSTQLAFEPPQSGDYIVRLQPELLRGARYHLLLRIEPSLGFPVYGAGRRNVQSVFGDARDAGARSHHGIDIFAPRGTPAIAASRARVTRVNQTPRGGRVVWLRDERRGASLYYAHLDTQLVAPGQVVEPGDTIGRVGNSGNARTTPPHLHFGVYSRGPVDPLPFVHVADTVASAPRISYTRLGTELLTRRPATVHAAPSAASPAIATLSADMPVRAWGGIRSWYRIELPDGRLGFVDAANLD